MSHASSSRSCNYDVFLSFSGKDTRINIVSNIYDALKQKGIRTFKDDVRLETGKPIYGELLKAIEEARIAVVIFSRRYASSRWCLEELAHIIKCKNELEQIVIPVFYDVTPSDVRHQNLPFADSFSQHEERYRDDMDKVQRWRDAFVEAGKLKGHHFPNFKDEAEFIKTIVHDISSKLLKVMPPLLEGLVGMESHVEKVTPLLDMESNDVRYIGIWGMGGIGKTEIANVVLQRYRNRFDSYCFLENVGKRFLANVGNFHRKTVQDVIRNLLDENLTLTSEHEGMNILQNRLRWKKVLFILDDVNDQKPLEFLVGGPEWFGEGSRIILTGRDQHLLANYVGNNLYEVPLLSRDEALELFSRHAFKEKSPKEDFMELSRQVVEYAGRLPLALKVLGPSFYRRDKKHWRHMIDRLEETPHEDILGKLRLSFDVLDKKEKELFLDIVFMVTACFDDSVRLYVELVLKDVSCDLLIPYLIEKSLLSINIRNSIVMHKMIREMGKSLIREEYANSRIWLPKEVSDLFKGKLITEKVESLGIPWSCYFKDDPVNIFKRMQNLKILIVRGTFSRNCTITFLPSSLRFIEWEGYPSISLPESSEPSQLIVLRLRKSCLVELWPMSKKLSNLKHLDLSYSRELRKSPNFSDMPNLERLNLRGCVNLEEIHPYLGHCRMLAYLSLRYCCKLKKLPKFVWMESLETLNLEECRSLQEFPEICGDMHRLSMLDVGSPWIRSLPLSLSGLRDLSLHDCEVLGSIPDAYRNLESLRIFDCNKLATLPNSLFESQQLETLVIRRCENLKKLPSFIQTESLKMLYISNCPKLDTFPEIKGDMHCLNRLSLVSTGVREVPSFVWHLRGLEYLCLEGFEDLVSLPDSLCNMMNLQRLYVSGCKKLEKLPENIGDLQELRELDVSETAISQTPPSITKLGKLWILSFSNEQQFQHSSNIALSSSRELHLSNHNILGGLPEDLGRLYISGSNISCLPKSINKLSRLDHLNIQYCPNLNELPGELPPNLEELFADYRLALKSIEDLVICCPKLCRLSISNYGTVSSVQVNEFLQHFRRTCIQCDFHQRDSFCIYFPDQVRIPALLDYDRFINQEKISIDLNPSWCTDKFMGFWISYGPSTLYTTFKATLVCKSDPERKYSLSHHMSGYSWLSNSKLNVMYPFICCAYVPFKTLWDAYGNKEGKNPNDYHMLELSRMDRVNSWGIRLQYENEAMNDIVHQKKGGSNE